MHSYRYFLYGISLLQSCKSSGVLYILTGGSGGVSGSLGPWLYKDYNVVEVCDV